MNISQVRITVLALAASLALGACSGGGGPTASSHKYRFIFVSHGACSNAFFAPVCDGFNTALSDLGISGAYRATNATLADPNQERQLIEAAIAEKPDGLILTDPQPDLLNPTIKSATAAGIPVVLANAGQGLAPELGALTYVGNDEFASGQLAAKEMNDLGTKHVLLVTLASGTLPLTDDRTNGFLKTYKGQTTRIDVTIQVLLDETQLKGVYESALQKDPSIDAVYSIGSCCSAAMLAARASLGTRAMSMHWGTIDLGTPVINGLKDRTLNFALDQQQFAFGYLPVVFLLNYLRYGIAPAQSFIATGPALVTPDNVGRLISAGTARSAG
jgi:simple sugar transport system substrate-binding protein